MISYLINYTFTEIKSHEYLKSFKFFWIRRNSYKLIIHYVYCLQLLNTCDIVSSLSFVRIRHPFNEFLTRLIIAHCSQLRLSLTCPYYQMSKRLHTMGNVYIYMHVIDYRMMLLPFRNENIIILRNLYSIAASCS